ncbi:hypothetical protein FAGAP_2711 [Fusarium agapanthi]|uniref:Uncharacterized protein n=1 Tax=Fusarium agapanthi TaxID=1803897 RepID=A0A9P5E9T8_9HYPO|nr:hypothetical protein FAGAP_2711 [Fusarium agapanthi]
MVADLKVGPRSRRSSASSRKSGDSDVTSPIENEAVDSFLKDDDIVTIFEAFVAETGNPINVRKDKRISRIMEPWNQDTLDEAIARLLSLEDHDIIRLYHGLSVKHRERKARRPSTSNTENTSAHRVRNRETGHHPMAQHSSDNERLSLCEEIAERVTKNIKGQIANEVTKTVAGLIVRVVEEVTAPMSQCLLKCIETMAQHHQSAADMIQRIDAARAANADLQQHVTEVEEYLALQAARWIGEQLLGLHRAHSLLKVREETITHRRGEKRKAPKTPATRRERVHPSLGEDGEGSGQVYLFWL